MKILLTLLSFLFLTPAFSENIGNVEYSLPFAAKDWTVHHRLENKTGTTIFYGPKQTDDELEFFAVNQNPFFTDITNTSIIEKGLADLLPGMEVDFLVLKLIKSRLIYEWSAKKEGIRKIHGWGEIFVNNEGTILLSYQTRKLSNLGKTRAIWLPVLVEAKRKL